VICIVFNCLKKEYGCIQRIGDSMRGTNMNQVNNVSGIAIMDEHLYISDAENRRIMIFKREDIYY